MKPQPSEDVCANCGDPYSNHGADTQCPRGINAKWFPSLIAKALTRQKRRIRKAQIELGKRRGSKMKPPCPTCHETHNPENACREAQAVAEQLRASLDAENQNCARCGYHKLAHGLISSVCPDGKGLLS